MLAFGLFLWVCPFFRQKEMFQIWHIILQHFIRKSFLSSVEFSRAIPLGINRAVMLYTSSTQSLNCGTSQLWRGKDLFLGSGQFTVNLCHQNTVFFILNINVMLTFVWNRHSATLMSQKLVIFGGRKTATYLNDLHVLDLGKMMMRCLDYATTCLDLSWYYFFLNEGRIHGVHSCEVWEHATAASRVSSAGLINLEMSLMWPSGFYIFGQTELHWNFMRFNAKCAIIFTDNYTIFVHSFILFFLLNWKLL